MSFVCFDKGEKEIVIFVEPDDISRHGMVEVERGQFDEDYDATLFFFQSHEHAHDFSYHHWKEILSSDPESAIDMLGGPSNVLGFAMGHPVTVGKNIYSSLEDWLRAIASDPCDGTFEQGPFFVKSASQDLIEKLGFAPVLIYVN